MLFTPMPPSNNVVPAEGWLCRKACKNECSMFRIVRSVFCRESMAEIKQLSPFAFVVISIIQPSPNGDIPSKFGFCCNAGLNLQMVASMGERSVTVPPGKIIQQNGSCRRMLDGAFETTMLSIG